ncbi:GNAT family N-acetyltransferase [Rhodospirillum rubrum]|uniref:GCN5-related N-acetyltransferase n=1 Tax=Rhodospirillum rubrum (strain ATCC 11170 / ATH 1.1.1 / DSM 467 / LMG 4362 / NCIMB 8255 / S1) TaxID=269796 RepID=Q2RX25_RHORT|nr:GNAT family N-acetyltransferase [Rhodospirillum rubrum]ABC21320.1 GCN5-related N-acetyltransferase [Rhodospirillum rubrum ATCC 11170]AEO47000.1 GCN5-related N-acetyltransferase [Rhodospirillum rubrum F11]MBK5952907.1 N-acetyltransferase [Rhodospirillum rubrum]QXG81002.1 GNAT family N-acetyltransferase [Rhodospirillum rubrum]HAP98977.1 N-acetyltransferase [Rhodospirillum rubrum]
MTLIRAARPGDAPFLPQIERSAAVLFRQIPDLAWIVEGPVQSEDRHRQMIEEGAVWVAVDTTDAPIGFLSAQRLESALHLWELSVDHDHQGRGLGRALVEVAKGWAIARGYPALTLTTFREVAWNEPFYRSLGFVSLSAGDLTEALRGLLAKEVEAGLPRDRRCAMRCLL